MFNQKVGQNEVTAFNAVENFVKRGAAKNLSSKSITTYKNRLGAFVNFLGADTPIDKVDADTIDDYTLHLKASGKRNDITILSYLRDLRTFLNFSAERGYIPKIKVSLPKIDKKIKETYTDEELAILLAKPDMDFCPASEYKTWAFTNFLVGTGCRISTALDVKVMDLDFGKGLILMNKTKNRKSQIIPMSSVLAEVLKEYIANRQDKMSEYLFSNRKGTKGDLRTFQGMIADYNKKRGVAKTSAHLYRHTFAKKWILNGGDMFRLQKILGHSDLTMVRNYVEMFGNDIAIDFNKFNALDVLLAKSKDQPYN